MKQYFQCKDEKELKDLMFIKPILGFVLFDMIGYCDAKKLPVTITSVIRTVEENNAVGAKSLTHVEGRAFDLSINGWETSHIEDFCVHFNLKYKKFAQPVALFHKGTAPHIHVQIFRDVRMN